MEILTIQTAGLGDATHLLVHDGRALLVDPQRDVDRFLDPLQAAGAELRFILETHIHNDYVSGGREAARLTGAELVVPAGAGVAFTHTPAFHMEELPAGGFSVRPIHTPGHTPEHMSYLVLIDGRPVALFSGGSLLVGSTGRSDLLGEARAEQLARLQYLSVQRLGELPGAVELLPTHGAGSFCTASGTGSLTSTIEQERLASPVFSYPDADTFVKAQLAGLQPYPAYYAHMGPINLLGPGAMPATTIPELTLEEAAGLEPAVAFVDVRPRAVAAAGHLPGSLTIELGDDFATWVGWLLPFNAPIVLVAGPDQDVDQAVRALARIGIESVRGVVRGVENDAAREPVSYATVDVRGFVAAMTEGKIDQVLDVRSPGEWEDAPLPGAVRCYLPDLVDAAPAGLDPARPVWVVCAGGYRGAVAGSLLERHGFQPVVMTEGGVAEIVRAGYTGL